MVPTLTGDKESISVRFNTPHNAWSEKQTVLSVDHCVVVLEQDHSITIKSRSGKLEQFHDTVLVYPGWYDAESELVTDTKHPVYKNAVFVIYKMLQKQKNKTGYAMFFQEQDPERQ